MSPAVQPGAVVTSASRAISSVADGSVVAISAFNMALTPEHLILELWRRYKRTGHLKNLFLIAL